MRYLFVVLFATICGCEPSRMQTAKQDFSCKDNGGVYSYTQMNNPVICNDGTSKSGWSGVILTKDFYPKPEVK